MISKSHTGVQSRQESKGSVSLSAGSKPAEQRAKEKAANDRRNARNRQALKDNPGSPLHRGFSAEKRLSLFDVLGLGGNEPVPSQACNTCIARGIADKCLYRGANERCRACQVLKLSGCSYFRPRKTEPDILSDMYHVGGFSLAHIRSLVSRLQVSRQQESVLRDALAREQAIALSVHVELFNALRGFAVNTQDREPFTRIAEDDGTLNELAICFSLTDVGLLKDLEDEGVGESSFAGLVSRLSPQILELFPIIRRHLDNCGYALESSNEGESTEEASAADRKEASLLKRKRKVGDAGLTRVQSSVAVPNNSPFPLGRQRKRVRLAPEMSEDEVDQLLSAPQQKLPSISSGRRQSVPPIESLPCTASSSLLSRPQTVVKFGKPKPRKR